MADLFDQDLPPSKHAGSRPLADRCRPTKITDVIGQQKLMGSDGSLSIMLESGKLPSIIFWGPPGVGKTTIARLLASEVNMHFVQMSAIYSGVSDLKKQFEAAKIRHLNGKSTLLFVDEIHRFNKSQQDGFLPFIENGTIVLVGATTENPSFELNSALLSRAQVMLLERLSFSDLELITQRAEREMKTPLPLDGEARELLFEMADGDGRSLLNLIEQIFNWGVELLNKSQLSSRLSKRAAQYDKNGDAHFNIISALHKSVRGSDPDAALYWLARMLEGGEDPRYIARRITRMAIEDIGLADMRAQDVCLQAWKTYERLGSPEGDLALAQAVLYLALAPKSNASYKAYKNALISAKKTGSKMPPKHILNAPTKLMKDMAYGNDYLYDHDQEDSFSGQNYFPDDMPRGIYYLPVERGEERELKKRIEFFSKLRVNKNKSTK